MVAANFPEAESILGEEGDALDEFCTLPCVKFGNDNAGGATVLTGDRGAAKLGRHEHIVIETMREWNIRRVAIVAREINKLRLSFRLNEFEEGGECHTAPSAVVLAPSGYAVKITFIGDLGEGIKLGPRKDGWFFHKTIDGQGPILKGNLRLHAEVEHGKPRREFLAGRESISSRHRPRLKSAGKLLRRPFLLGLNIAFFGHKEVKLATGRAKSKIIIARESCYEDEEFPAAPLAA